MFFVWLLGFFLYVLLIVNKGKLYTKCPMEVEDYQESAPVLDPSLQRTFVIEKYVANRTEGRAQNIPYNIFQTNEHDVLPLDMKYSIDSVVMKNPEYTYRFFNGTERREFMGKYMGKTMLDVYDKIIPLAFKADIFRYSIIYVFGGCYMDIGFVAIDSIIKFIHPQHNFVTTEDANPENYALNSAFFCSVPGHKVIGETLSLIVKAISTENYGVDPIDITGPRRYIVGFRNAFPHGKTMQIKLGQYSDGVMLYHRGKAEDYCLISTIEDKNGRILFYNKYPHYYIDMKWYTKTQRYMSFWYGHKTFDVDLKVHNAENFNVLEIPARKNNVGQLDKIPLEFRN